MVQKEIDSDYQYSDFLTLNEFTPLAMASQLTQKKFKVDRMAIATRLTGDSPQKLFMLPPLLGEGCFTYKHLAEHYSDAFDVSVYGLSSPVLFDDQPLPNSLDEEAEQFYKAMKGIQPEGPYRVFGFSYGVTLAWKVAELCIRNGDKIDTWS